MTKHIRSLFGLALLVAAVSASAQITQTIRVTVPFPFVAVGKTWPAADYKVQITQPTGLVTLSSASVAPAIVMTNKNEHPGRDDGRSYLRFELYGDSWVLEEVTYDGTEQVLHMSKVERQLAKLKPSGQRTLMASNVSGH